MVTFLFVYLFVGLAFVLAFLSEASHGKMVFRFRYRRVYGLMAFCVGAVVCLYLLVLWPVFMIQNTFFSD
jgi:hypothetical protein